ncbi:MAG: phosphate ABC transporter permease PtsA [Deltaproteobacteria bacterium]|nr:MAG: phosphate ABC transporter permease PtsA [Deltaproteobacteria bacterium]
MISRSAQERMWFAAFRIAALTVLLFLFAFLLILSLKGARVINWEFLTQSPREGMTEGGIFPAILGTLYLSLGAVLLAFPVGVMTAIYLTFYAPRNPLTQAIRVSISNLAGTPSIVFGLFGLALFVKTFGFGVSILSGVLTLGLLVLPIVIRASEEALRAVPQEFLEASYALGATKLQTIRSVVLPAASGGILTGVILSLARAAGETAPILFTAASFYTTELPKSPFDETLALPFHIFALMTEGTAPEAHTRIAFGATLVLLALVLSLNLVAIIQRYRLQRGKKW